MTEFINLHDHMAFTCECGSVRFNLLRSGGIECAGCCKRIDASWSQAAPKMLAAVESLQPPQD